MPRGERPLDDGDSPLLRFARDLRLLREKAGKPTYRELSAQAHYSEAALSQAAAGRKLPTLPITLAYVRACGGAEEDWERRWREVAAELAPPPPDDDDRSDPPYVGLNAFQPGDADRFFGRERLVRELESRLERQRVVVVVGASGVGKSSLLRAGLIPRLDGRVVVFTPGAHPLAECARHLSAVPGDEAPDDRDLAIVVDQFEEIFTLCRDHEERCRFIDTLLTTARMGRCRVVLGVRADFYAHCTAFPELVDAVREGQVTVGPMTPDELRRAITSPAARVGLMVETALVTELVAQAKGQVGVLPLLSHALLETWRRRRGRTLSLTGYQVAGGIEGALAQTAESVLERLTERQRDLVRNLMLRLTALGDGTEDTKRRVARGELADDPDTGLVLDLFARARLITLDHDSVEIAHEAMIASWPRLRGWLAEDREGLRLHRELTEATDGWEALDRDRGALYRGVRLERAHEWAAHRADALSVRERDFLDASWATAQAEHAQTRRHGRRLKQLVALLSLLLLLAVTATAYAFEAERVAASQRNTALSQIVAGKATALRRSDPSLAAQLSVAALRLSPTDEARASLLGAIPFPNLPTLRGHTGHVNAVSLSPDGRLLLTSSHDGTARLWDVRDPHRAVQLSELRGHTATVNAAVFRPDGAVVATAGWDHQAKLWDIGDPRHPVELATLSGHTDEVNAVAFSPDGRTLATAGSDNTARLWDVTNPRAPGAPTTLAGHTDAVVSVAFAPHGRTLATASFDHSVGLWDLAGSGAPRFLTGHGSGATWVAFDARGTRLASAGQDGTARIWDPVSGGQLAVLLGHHRIVRSVAFGPDGRLATAGEDGTARLWDVSGPVGARQLAVLEAHLGPVVSVWFGPDGGTLATGSDDNTAMLWSIPRGWPDSIDPAQAADWLCTQADKLMTSDDWAAYFPGLPFQPPCPRS